MYQEEGPFSLYWNGCFVCLPLKCFEMESSRNTMNVENVCTNHVYTVFKCRMNVNKVYVNVFAIELVPIYSARIAMRLKSKKV